MTNTGFTLRFTKEAAQDGEALAYLLGRLTNLTFEVVTAEDSWLCDIDHVEGDTLHVRSFPDDAPFTIHIPDITELIYQ